MINKMLLYVYVSPQDTETAVLLDLQEEIQRPTYSCWHCVIKIIFLSIHFETKMT